MSMGFGAGFFVLTLGALLAGLARIVLLGTIAIVAFNHRVGRVSSRLLYRSIVSGIGILGLALFGVVVMYDEAPMAAWLLASLAVLPLLVWGTHLWRTSELSNLDVITTIVIAWSLPFFFGVAVFFGVTQGIQSVLDLAPVEFRQLRVGWIAVAFAALNTIIGMAPLVSRVRTWLPAATTQQVRG
jgi:hypothetical protein